MQHSVLIRASLLAGIKEIRKYLACNPIDLDKIQTDQIAINDRAATMPNATANEPSRAPVERAVSIAAPPTTLFKKIF